MNIVPNPSLIFTRVPKGLPIPGLDLTVLDKPFDLNTPPPHGGLVTKNLFSSLDPYMRGLLLPPAKSTYRPSYTLDSPIASACIARVHSSAHPDYSSGDLVLARLPLQEYSALMPSYLSTISPPTKLSNLHKSTNLALFLGPLGMPGLTAYSSFYEICSPRAGETIFISAASSAVGSLVGQLALRAGLIVIGSVGSPAKASYLIDELGFHAAFNYKTESAAAALARDAPAGIDIYYDNVGGEQLAAALNAMKPAGGRVAVCGMISQYNLPEEERYGVKNLFQLVAKGITMRGFKQQDEGFGPKWRERHAEDVGRWLAEGTLKMKMDERVGVKSAAVAFKDVLEGRTDGKVVVRIHEGDGGM